MYANARRWTVLAAYAALAAGSFVAAYALRFGGPVPATHHTAMVAMTLCAVGVKLFSFCWHRLDQGVNRYIGFHDLATIARATTWSTIGLTFVNAIVLPEVNTPRGPRSSHTFNIVTPGEALDEATLQNSCSGCHEEDPAALGDLIDDIQVDTRARVENARAAVTDDTPDWVVTALDAVERDGSAGVHNYAYTDALLDAAEAELNLTATADEEA